MMVDSFPEFFRNFNPVISWLMTGSGIAVVFAPTILTWRIACRRIPRWRTAISGTVFGLTIMPISFWLYGQFYLGPVRAIIFGFPGLFLFMAHVFPAQTMASPLLSKLGDNDLVPAMCILASVGGFMWGVVYGTAGTVVDLVRARKKNLPTSRTQRMVEDMKRSNQYKAFLADLFPKKKNTSNSIK